MRIGIDARLYSETGIGRYIRNLLLNLEKIDTENDYYVFLLKKDFEKATLGKNFHKVEADIKWYSIAEQTRFPKLLYKYNLDLMHFPHFNVPLFYRRKFVVTIHDLIHQHFQMRRATTLNPLVYRLKHNSYELVFSSALKRSRKIITPSDFVKRQIVNEWDLDAGKIVVTKEAAEDRFVKLAAGIKNSFIDKTLKKYGIKEPYIFYVGNAHPHKNVEGLIKALRLLNETPRLAELPWDGTEAFQLVLIGSDHYFWKRIRQDYKGKDIVYTGYVSDEELAAIYKGALCFVMPSFEEGFGIPLLEAMSVGCPVVSSNAASLPEVGGDDAAIYFDPHNINEMAKKIEDVVNDPQVRLKLIKAGLERYKMFDWKKLATETLRVYKEP